MAFLEVTVVDSNGLGAALQQANRFIRDFNNKLPRVTLKKHKQQIRERILAKKSGPSNEPWPEWSAAYANTRTAAHGLLINDRKLVNAWQTTSSSGQGALTNTMVYAAAQHFGYESIPARPYAGVGSTDIEDLTQVINHWVEQNFELIQ